MTIDYSIRVSQRARRLQIRISLAGMVEVVVPQGMSIGRVQPFVREHRDWIRKTRARLLDNHGQADDRQRLPDTIDLAASADHWATEYVLRPGVRSSLLEAGGSLRVTAADEVAARLALQRWLTRRARCYLAPRLQQLAAETGLSFQRLTIRAQKTRWGSCSSAGTISLNRSLMFLATDLVRYLMVHELCHTVHMNHSRRYWALVERMEPAYRHHERCLRAAAMYIPAWAQPISPG